MLEKQKYQEVYSYLLKANSIVLVIHENPDGDAWSSLAAFAQLVNSLGKTWQALIQTFPINSQTFLAQKEKFLIDKNLLNWQGVDLVISLDCGSLARTCLAGEIMARGNNFLFLEIDHHPNFENIADFSLRDIGAASTTKVLYDFFQANNLVITASIAQFLLAGLATDTGNFVYANANAEALSAVACLLKNGARLDLALALSSKRHSINSMRLWGLAIERLKINNEFGVASTYLLQQDYSALGGSESELEDLAGFLSGLVEAPIFLLLKEMESGIIKGSLRSNSDAHDVGALARALGGGGHARAAGFILKYDFR